MALLALLPQNEEAQKETKGSTGNAIVERATVSAGSELRAFLRMNPEEEFDLEAINILDLHVLMQEARTDKSLLRAAVLTAEALLPRVRAETEDPLLVGAILADKTLARIARGIRRYVLEAAEPFLVPATHGGYRNGRPRQDHRVYPLGEPMRTITGAHRGELQLVAPTLVQTGYGERPGQAPRCLDLQKPLGTIISGGTGGNGKHALVSAFLAKHYGGHEGPGTSPRLPFSTITCQDHHALTAAFLTKYYGTSTGSAAGLPIPTITANGKGGGHLAEVRAFLIKYYGTGSPAELALPLDTVTTRDRFGLVMLGGEPYELADIGMRMLSPRELYRAQGFPDSYQIDPVVEDRLGRPGPLSKTAQIRMCGNSVTPPVAAALVRAQFAMEAEVAA